MAGSLKTFRKLEEEILPNLVKIGFDQDIVDIILEHGGSIIESPEFQREKEYIQHGTTTTYAHSLCVAYISVWLALRSRKKIDMKSVVRGALLHDYFLYDWHEKNEYHNLHGYTHAKRAMENAKRDFKITPLESEIIYCHMFPLNLSRVPKSREARTVCIADKLVAGSETLLIMQYSQVMAGHAPEII